jgi:mRNA-degrading endonuclease RelE of RelBE toxin-antitoxin system
MPTVEIAKSFIRRLKELRKKYPHVTKQVQTLISQLESGDTPGDQIQGTGYTAYKTRLANPDAGKGKSGGYRVIYYIRTADRVIAILIYSKSDQVDVSTDEIKLLIEEYLNSHP